MSEYVSYLKELLEEFGNVEMRRMFGGYGVFYQGLMFGLIADDILYLKADKEFAREFERKGLEPFKYTKKNKIVTLSYYQAPEEAMEDPAEMAIWAEQAYAVAVQSQLK